MHFYQGLVRLRSLGVLVMMLFMIFSASNAFALTESDLYLITDKANEKNRIVDKRTIRSIYGLRSKRWPSGVDLTVFVLPDDTAIHQIFCLKVLNVLPYQLRKRWDRLIFSG